MILRLRPQDAFLLCLLPGLVLGAPQDGPTVGFRHGVDLRREVQLRHDVALRTGFLPLPEDLEAVAATAPSKSSDPSRLPSPSLRIPPPLQALPPVAPGALAKASRSSPPSIRPTIATSARCDRSFPVSADKVPRSPMRAVSSGRPTRSVTRYAILSKPSSRPSPAQIVPGIASRRRCGSTSNWAIPPCSTSLASSSPPPGQRTPGFTGSTIASGGSSTRRTGARPSPYGPSRPDATSPTTRTPVVGPSVTRRPACCESPVIPARPLRSPTAFSRSNRRPRAA